MLKLIFAETAPAGTYPPYINVSAIVGDPANDGIRFIVRDEAVQEHTENGSHLHAGHVSTAVITREQALMLADAIKEHYGEEDAIIATKRIENGLTLGQEETAATEVPMPTGVVEAAQADGKNTPARTSAPLAPNHDEHCGAGDHGFDVIAEQPHLRDSEFVPAGGSNPGDESVKA